MEKQQTHYFIYFAAFSIQSIVFSVGTSYSWTSPFLPKFDSNDSSINPVSKPITTTEAGLMVSILNLGLFVGPVIPSLTTEKLGKKTTMLISAIPLLAGHIMCIFATSVDVFLVARFLMGLSSGATWSAIPGYLGEISEPKNRGLLGSFISVMSSSGGLFGYCVGPFLSMKWFSIVNLVPIIFFYISVYFFIPESPYDLIIKNKLKKAERSLIVLRKRKNVQIELSEITKSIEANIQSEGKFVDLFKDLSIFKIVMLGSGLMILNGVSGICAVLGYTQTIFDLAGSSIPSAYSAIAVSCVAFLATIIHIKLVDKLGRKVLLIISCFSVFVSLLTLGAFFYLKENKFKTDSFDWIPVCSLVLYMFGYYFGFASVPYIMLGEIFPSRYKTMASSFCMSINFLLSFVLTLIFPYLMVGLGIANTFWFFSILNAFGFIFCLKFVPETKGKSLQEIGLMLNKNG